MKNTVILCMGGINMDLTMYSDHLPAVGESVKTDNFFTFPGGKAANQAAAAALLGGSVRFFSRMGTDDFSRQLIRLEQDRGIDMDHVIPMEGKTSGVAMILVSRSTGQNMIVYDPGPTLLTTPEDILRNEQIFDGCGILEITTELPSETVYTAIRLAKQKGLSVMIDPSPMPAGGFPEEICRMIDYTKPNENEAEALTGISVTNLESASRALQELLRMGFRYPIISLASQGALAWTGTEEYYVRPVRVDAVDPTAAGDNFLGGLSSALSRGLSFKDALEFANAAAAISVTRKGAQTSVPAYNEVMALLKKEGRL